MLHHLNHDLIANVPTVTYIIRHSRLPALWFCQNFFIYFYFYCFFFRRQGFRMITFDRQAGPLQNLNRSQVMGRSVSFSTPRNPRWGRGATQTPQNPPPPKKKLCMRFRTPGKFLKKNLVGTKTFISVTKNFHPPPHTPPPHPHAPAQPSEHSPQPWCNNKYSQQFLCEIWTTTTNTSNK